MRLGSLTGYAVASPWEEGAYLPAESWLNVVISIIRSILLELLPRLGLDLVFSFDGGGRAVDGFSGDCVLINCGGVVIVMESEGRWPFAGE